MNAAGALRNKGALAAGAIALFAFLVVYEVHFVTVVNDMGEMNQRMQTLSRSLASVRGIDDMRDELKKLGPELTTVNRQLSAVRRNTRAVEALPGLERRLAPVAQQMRDLRTEIGLMRSAIDPLQPMAGDVAGMRAGIARLLGDIEAIEAEMQQVRRHVSNIDRKTGPPPPEALPTRAR